MIPIDCKITNFLINLYKKAFAISVPYSLTHIKVIFKDVELQVLSTKL